METIFKILLFGWAMVGLFVMAQCLVWVSERMPAVWKWRRKHGK